MNRVIVEKTMAIDSVVEFGMERHDIKRKEQLIQCVRNREQF